jgi:transcriptional regulator with XRE-family HTH domain
VAEIFGQNVRVARERRHMKQGSLARFAGLSRAGLSPIERGVCETTIETLLSLGRSLEVTPGFLLGGIAWEPRQPLQAPRGDRRPVAQGVQPRRRDQEPLGRWQDRRRDRHGRRHFARGRVGHRSPSARAWRSPRLSQRADQGVGYSVGLRMSRARWDAEQGRARPARTPALERLLMSVCTGMQSERLRAQNSGRNLPRARRKGPASVEKAHFSFAQASYRFRVPA